jgi:hypothetical protein
MKRLDAAILLAIGLSPVFAFGRSVAFSNQKFFQQNTLSLAGQPVAATRRVSVAETTAVHVEWSKTADQVNGSISRDKLTRMKDVTGNMVTFLQDSCFVDGGYSPSWHGEYNSDKNSPGAQLKFGVTCHFAAQNADLSITANDLQPLLDQLEVNGRHYLTMRIPSASEKHSSYFADDHTKMWLVTARNGMLPFAPVSRKEYLVQAKAELSAMVQSIEAGWKLKVPVRSAAVQEAERKAVVEQLKSMYSGTDLDIRVRVYMHSYKSDEEFQKANIVSETAGFRATMRLMDSLMVRLGAAELAKPAVVSVGAADFRGFEDGQSDYMLIRINEAYFDTKLSDEMPQLFLVTWHYEGADTSALELDRRLTEKLDGRVLQAMLDK